MNKIVKILLWIIGILIALPLLVSLLAPPIAKSYVNSHSEELIGRKAHIDGLRLNLFTGHAAVHGLAVYEDDATSSFASLDTLDIKLHLLKLPFKTLYLKHITISGLSAAIAHDSSGFNFASIIDHFASTDTIADTTPSDWTLKIYNIRLSHASLSYADLDAGKHWRVPDINLRVPGFVIGGDEQSSGGLHLAFDKGGNLLINGTYDATTNHFGIDAKLDRFAIANLDMLLEDIIQYSSISGNINADLHAAGNINDINTTFLTGNINADAISLLDADGEVAGFNNFAVDIAGASLGTNHIDIASIRLDSLRCHYDVRPDGSNIDRLFPPADTTHRTTPTPTTDTISTPPSQPLSLTIGSLIVDGARLLYDDHTLPEPFSFAVTSLGIQASDLTTSGSNAARLRATLPGGAMLLLNWKGNIDNWKHYQDIFLTIRGLDLRQFSPWALAYTGQPIEEGVFTLTSRNTINASNIAGDNKLDIYRARVGSRRKELEPEIKLPLKTALYVLKDKDEKINIDMPIKGNIDNPEFNYMKIVWKTLGNLVVKVATSPMRAVAGAIGLTSSDIDFIPFAPDQHGLTSEQYHTLGQLAEVLNYDTLITLQFTQVMPAPADSTDHSQSLRDDAIRQYLSQLGADTTRINFDAIPPTSKRDKTGYRITSHMPAIGDDNLDDITITED